MRNLDILKCSARSWAASLPSLVIGTETVHLSSPIFSASEKEGKEDKINKIIFFKESGLSFKIYTLEENFEKYIH